MDKLLKQRLIGAIVLVALGVIFIPALLDGSGYKSRHSQTIEIPDKPEFAPKSQLAVTPVKTPIDTMKHEVAREAREIKAVVPQKPKIEAKETENKEAVKQTTTPASSIEALALQVGTFDQESNANSLRDKLRKSGHPAYVEASVIDGKKSFRVRIGPELDRKRLEALKDKLRTEESLDSFITSHP